MPVGFMFRGEDRDVIVLGATLKEAEREYRKNKAAIDRALKSKETSSKQKRSSSKSGSTIATQILKLKGHSFFKTPRFMSEIIERLESWDYHYKPSQLTDPLWKLVLSWTSSPPSRGPYHTFSTCPVLQGCTTTAQS